MASGIVPGKSVLPNLRIKGAVFLSPAFFPFPPPKPSTSLSTILYDLPPSFCLAFSFLAPLCAYLWTAKKEGSYRDTETRFHRERNKRDSRKSSLPECPFFLPSFFARTTFLARGAAFSFSRKRRKALFNSFSLRPPRMKGRKPLSLPTSFLEKIFPRFLYEEGDTCVRAFNRL